MNGAAAYSPKRIVGHLCALVVGGFFLYAAAEKIVDARQFAIDINNYKILPELYANIPAILMPWWEVGAAIALLIPATRKAGAILVAAMLLFFIGAVGYSALYLGLKISCGCTGDGSSFAGWMTIGRNALLLVGTFLSVFFCPARQANEGAMEFQPHASEQPA